MSKSNVLKRISAILLIFCIAINVDVLEPQAKTKLNSKQNLKELKPLLAESTEVENLESSEYNGYIFKLKDEDKQQLNADELINNEMYYVDSLDELSKLAPADEIEYIEPNYINYLCDESFEPNDPYYKNSDPSKSMKWAFTAVNAQSVWKEGFFGKYKEKTPTVAILDTGVAEHPDLKNVLPGKRYLSGEATKYTGDIDWHGTFVAGIIAAAMNNGIGGTGVMPDVKIYPINVFQKLKNGTILSDDRDLIKGIEDAIDKGVDVINLSLGGKNYTQHERDVIDKAIGKGIIVVAASGNYNSKKEKRKNTKRFYPASFDDVISVGAINKKYKKTWFSYYNNKVDIAAPGKNIVSTAPLTTDKDGTKYYYRRYGDGTSFAAPFVSALAAMYKAIKPEGNAEDFMSLIKTTSKDVGKKGKDNYYGYGIANFGKMYQELINNSCTNE